MTEKNKPRSTTELDALIGARVRLARQLCGLSQSELGDRLNVSFQQVQKYESGANRVAAQRLYEIAQVVGKPITYFYPADNAADADEADAPLESFKNLQARTVSKMLHNLDECDDRVRDQIIAMISNLRREDV
ncbi:helix-turn-helix domain-containing protein [Euryhalocaulis caribicus]|uniref:helix-turn-helix domain-containing protein n=1 Tax=Euryhalocaulis caribicus TaxID=1161401 RepID=UPI0003AA26FD|nr:helix-turn-helix transcriptional regulator [Euryhalocaulis caribicus]